MPIDSTVTGATFSVAMDVKGTIRVFRPNGTEVLGSDGDATITDLPGSRILNVASPAPRTLAAGHLGRIR